MVLYTKLLYHYLRTPKNEDSLPTILPKTAAFGKFEHHPTTLDHVQHAQLLTLPKLCYKILRSYQALFKPPPAFASQEPWHLLGRPGRRSCGHLHQAADLLVFVLRQDLGGVGYSLEIPIWFSKMTASRL